MLTHAPPHLCYHAEFGRSRSNAVGKIGKGIPEKVRELRTPLWMGQGWPVRNTPRPTWVTMLNLITFGQTVWVEISQKNKPLTSRLSAFQWNSKSSELTRISSDQSGNYLLLVIITWAYPYHFQHIANVGQKLWIFPTPCIYCPLTGSSLEFGKVRWAEKN